MSLRNKLSGSAQAQAFLREMLSDPLVRLVMQSDGVTEAQLRHSYSGPDLPEADCEMLKRQPEPTIQLVNCPDASAIQIAENEGMRI